MYEQNNTTYYENKNRPSILLVLFIVFQIIFVITVVVIITQFNQARRMVLNIDTLAKVDITNDSAIPDLSDPELVESIEQTLFTIVAENSETKTAKHSLKANFHEDSISAFTFSGANLHYFSSIIDVPELSESYQLLLQYSTDYINYTQPSFIIVCPEENNNLYPSFKCQNIISRNEIVRYIGSQIPIFSFDGFSAYMKPENYTTVFIGPISNTVTESDKVTYMKQTKEAIKSLGISPDQFDYYVLTEKDIVYDY